jgi:hypothetical protein
MLVRPLGAVFLAALVGCARAPAPPVVTFGELPRVPPGQAAIQGPVHDVNTGVRVAGALVILQCACLPGHRETETDARGIYSFVDLPPGKYTVQVLFGRADVSKSLQLAPGKHFIARFAIDPTSRIRIETD